MMAGKNPRSEIMGNILTACKSVDRQLTELETQSESLHLAAGDAVVLVLPPPKLSWMRLSLLPARFPPHFLL